MKDWIIIREKCKERFINTRKIYTILYDKYDNELTIFYDDGDQRDVPMDRAEYEKFIHENFMKTADDMPAVDS